MAARSKIFIAYCSPDKKWLDRLQTEIAPASGLGKITAWDERKLHAGITWRAELAEIIDRSGIVLVFVSELFLDSDFLRRARLPELLQKARQNGGEVRWILVSHCQHELAGFEESQALNNLDSPLDGLSAAGREAVLAGIGRQVKALAAGESPAPEVRDEVEENEAASGGALTASPYLARLGGVIETRTRTVVLLRRLRLGLLPFAIGTFLLGIVVAAVHGNLSLLLLIAGYGVFVLALAHVLGTRADLFAQSLIGIRCVKTGLADETLPERQRGDLMKRAKEVLGEP